MDRRIADGQSDDEIRAYFSKTLGDDILLRPPASGWGGLVWVLPVVALVLAAAGIGVASSAGPVESRTMTAFPGHAGRLAAPPLALRRSHDGRVHP